MAVEHRLSLDLCRLDRDLIRLSEVFASEWLGPSELSDLATRNYKNQLRVAQFVFGRVLLKKQLAKVFDRKPSSISIQTLSGGRPVVHWPDGLEQQVCLSVSHDHSCLLVGIAQNCLFGVDIQSLQGVDWLAVNRAMGWSGLVESLAINVSVVDNVYLPVQSCSCLVWAAYEAWMKLTSCRFSAGEFVWKSLEFVEKDFVTGHAIYEMVLADSCPYSESRLLLELRSEEVIPIATYST